MDGLNPTLALAALLFGLSGHPHEVAPDVQQQASIGLPADFGCAEMTAVAAIPPAIPVGSSPTAEADAESGSSGVDLGWEEILPVEPEDRAAAKETGCGHFLPQP